MGGDLPDYSRQITVLLNADILAQMRQLPWWVRYAPARILNLDDFEGVLKWSTGAGTVAKYSGVEVFENTYCLKLTTGGVADDNAEAQLYIGAVPRSKIALQLRWNTKSDNEINPRSFYFKLVFQDGEYTSEAGVRYLKNLSGVMEKWQYWGADQDWHDIPNAAEVVQCTIPVHQSLYAVIDYKLDKLSYIRLVTSKLDLDLSSLGIHHRSEVGVAKLFLYIVTDTDVNVAIDSYVDALCLSDQEA